MDREAWRAVIHGIAKSWTRLSDWTELKPLMFMQCERTITIFLSTHDASLDYFLYFNILFCLYACDFVRELLWQLLHITTRWWSMTRNKAFYGVSTKTNILYFTRRWWWRIRNKALRFVFKKVTLSFQVSIASRVKLRSPTSEILQRHHHTSPYYPSLNSFSWNRHSLFIFSFYFNYSWFVTTLC